MEKEKLTYCCTFPGYFIIKYHNANILKSWVIKAARGLLWWSVAKLLHSSAGA